MSSMMKYPRPRNEAVNSFDAEWFKVRHIVLALLNQNQVTQREWQDLFMYVYNIHSWIENGGENVRIALNHEISMYVMEARKRIHMFSEEGALLRSYITEWTKYFTQADILPLPFKSIDAKSIVHGMGHRLQQELKKEGVREVMLERWNEAIFQPISPTLLHAALKLVEQERNGENLDSRLVIGVRQSFVSLNENNSVGMMEVSKDPLDIYRKTFEKRFIEDTVEYYKKIASQYLAENGVLNFMCFADKKLEEEEHRAQKYLDNNAESLKKHVDACVGVLVCEFEEQILAECSNLIDKNDVDKLRMLYRLVKRTPNGIDVILTRIDEHIRTVGLNDMKANADTITQDPEQYVTQLLAMFERFSLLVKEGFYDDARLLTARDKAFREVVNDTSIFRTEMNLSKRGRNVAIESKCSELLANYCDLLLRKTQLSRKLSSEEIDQKLNNLLLVLKYVSNKDVFMRFHKAHLSRRLILDMSADQEKEESMVNKLRESGMPAEHVNKLYRMLQDIEVNKDLNQNFKKSLVGTNNNRMVSDLINIKVLNGGAWGRGGADKVRVSLPRELEDFVPEVEAFYKKQHNGRKLNWMHHWSNGTMIFGTNTGGRFDLEVTTFQMAVLFTWNERAKEGISFETLRLATELPDTELARTLYSLVAFPKMKSQVLLCDADSPINPREFNDSTIFRINHDFHLIKNGKRQNRGRLNMIGRLQLSMEAGAGKEHEDIVALRTLRVQEAAVKIMKVRKIITSAQLQTELVEMLKPMFLPNRKLIKEQIDWLIDNAYIERKKDDINTFVYLT